MTMMIVEVGVVTCGDDGGDDSIEKVDVDRHGGKCLRCGDDAEGRQNWW